jgi:hypothetical protein
MQPINNALAIIISGLYNLVAAPLAGAGSCVHIGNLG